MTCRVLVERFAFEAFAARRAPFFKPQARRRFGQRSRRRGPRGSPANSVEPCDDDAGRFAALDLAVRAESPGLSILPPDRSMSSCHSNTSTPCSPMTARPSFVLATHNEHKRREFERLLSRSSGADGWELQM